MTSDDANQSGRGSNRSGRDGTPEPLAQEQAVDRSRDAVTAEETSAPAALAPPSRIGFGALGSVRPRAQSVADVETDDSWGDSEIDAALKALEDGPSPRTATESVAEGPPTFEVEEQTRFFERPSVALSVSAIEKSRKGDGPASGPSRSSLSPGLGALSQTPARAQPRGSAHRDATSEQPVPPLPIAPGTSGDGTPIANQEEPTRFFRRPDDVIAEVKHQRASSASESKPEPSSARNDRSLLASAATNTAPPSGNLTATKTEPALSPATAPTPPSPPQAAASGVSQEPEVEEVTHFFDRASFGPELTEAIARRQAEQREARTDPETPVQIAAGLETTANPSVRGPLSSRPRLPPSPATRERDPAMPSGPPRPSGSSVRAENQSSQPPAGVGSAMPSAGDAAIPPIAEAARPEAAEAPPNAVPTMEAPSVEPPRGEAAQPVADPMSERSNEPLIASEPPAVPALTGVTAFSLAPRSGLSGSEDDASGEGWFERVASRLLRTLAAASVTAVVLAGLDAWFARAGAVDRPSWVKLWIASAGLSVPTALGVALLAGVLTLLLYPDQPPSLRRIAHELRPTDTRRKARLAIILLTTPLAVSCWMLLVGRAALPVLGSAGADGSLGFVLACLTVGLGVLSAIPVLSLARYVGIRLRKAPPDPIRWGTLGLFLGAVPLALSISLGPTSGSGGTFGIWGVFRRPELDLRLVSMLLTIAFLASCAQAVLKNVKFAVLILVALLPLGFTFRAGSQGMKTRAVAIAIERGAPLGRVSLGVLRKLTDHDRDGFSPKFGGGDCNDSNRTVSPGADDVPSNGVDEDCSGADAAPQEVFKGVQTPAAILLEKRQALPGELNLILITIDTLRADVLGHPRRIVPHLDALAKSGAKFEKAYAPASYTGKSVGPILIGKHSSETHRDFSHFNAFAKGEDRFVQQRLQSASIQTVSVQGYWYFHQPPYGFNQGFDVIDSSASAGSGYVEGDRTSTSLRLADAVLSQLGKTETSSRRFALWAHFTDPHVEYVAHEGFDFGSGSLERYWGEAAFVDFHVGRIIDFVKAQPWGNRTAIIVTSDHGEAFGEHGMIRHGFELWEALVRVPLIVYVPGIEPQVRAERRSIIDVAPTIVDLMQGTEPAGDGPDFFSGVSLLPELLGIESAQGSRPLLIDMAAGPFNAERQAYIHGDLKLIASQGRPLGLYDLAADPAEKRDLLDDPTLREKMVGEFRAYRKSMRVVEVKGKSP